MNVICQQDNLARGLSIVNRAVASRTTLPILSNILMRAEGDRLKLSATNLEIGISCWIEAEVREAGAITVPARLLGDFVNSLPAEPVELKLDAKRKALDLSAGRYHADIKGIDAEDFPIMPTIDDGTSFTLDPAQLREMVAQVTIAAATDESRPILTGVQTVVDPDAGRVTMAAADGFRMSIREASFDAPLDGKVSVVIPARALQELGRVVGDADGPVRVSLTENRNQILFHTGHVDIVSQLIDGNFPDVEKIIPAGYTTRAVVNAKALHGAVRIASFFARDSANVVRLKLEPGDDLNPGILTVSAQSAEVGGNQSELEASIEGEAIEIAFNAKYMLDLLGALGSEQVAIEVSTPSSPGVYRPVDETEFTHVIMPMHIAR
ncbi:MAG: DNA polymerase III subunit beta [Chloroflexi bacterium]|nr:DNA polymerase III subunit beta [Chloroflexota bacterium]